MGLLQIGLKGGMMVPEVMSLGPWFVDELEKRKDENSQILGGVIIPIMKPSLYQGVGESYFDFLVRGNLELAIKSLEEKLILSALFFQVDLEDGVYHVIDRIGEVGFPGIMSPFGILEILASADVPKEDENNQPAPIKIFGAIRDDKSDDGDIDRLLIGIPEHLAIKMETFEGERVRDWWKGTFWGE